MEELKIEPKFRDLIPPLTEAEQRQLEENILDAGQIYEPIVVWNGTIIDGHHRYEIAMKYPDITWSTREIDFPNEYAAMAWACANQLGRRNLNDFQKADLYTMQYDNDRKAHGASDGFRGNQYSEVVKDPIYPLPKNQTTIQKIAEQHNVPEGTMKKNIELGHGISKGEEMVPGFRDAILTGKAKASKKELRSIRLMDDETAKKTAETIIKGEPETKVCSKCGRKLPISDFYKRGNATRSECKRCFEQNNSSVETSITGKKLSISPEYKNLTYEDVVGNLNGKEEVEYTDIDFVEELNAIFDGFEKSVERCFFIHDGLSMSGECKRTIAARMTKARENIEKWEDKYCGCTDEGI